jgi:hypothetical protein
MSRASPLWRSRIPMKTCASRCVPSVSCVSGTGHRQHRILRPCCGESLLRVDAVEKRSEWFLRATSIPKMSRIRNFDSNDQLSGFDCCALRVRRRLFQQHRSTGDMPDRNGS